jgi:hypothetical protein
MQNARKNNNFIRLWLKWAIPFALIAVIILLKFFPGNRRKKLQQQGLYSH